MTQILIVSADPKSAQAIIRTATQYNISYKAISQIETAKDWLALNLVSAILIDSRYGASEPLTLASYLWSTQPKATAIVFNCYGEIAQKWQLTFAGVQCIAKEKFAVDLANMLAKLPQGTELQTFNKKILLVEDLEAPRTIITNYIEAFNLGKVMPVACANDALTALKDNPNDYYCIVTDINMPDMNGIQLTEEIRKNPATRPLPVIVCTAYPSQDNLIKALNAGVTGFLTKPLKKELMKAEIEKAQRIFINKISPCICEPQDTTLISEVFNNTTGSLIL